MTRRRDRDRRLRGLGHGAIARRWKNGASAVGTACSRRHAIGGMASVWRAINSRTGEIVAVKRLHPYLLADAVARERLEREASALAALHHPNIIEVRDSSSIRGSGIGLGSVPGRTAAEAVALDGPFPEPEALAIGAAVGDALAAAHRAQIVHRDVTPSNVLLGDDGRVRLADFGSPSRMMTFGQLTRADGVIGTLRYLAPERLAGRPATPASDVWALAPCPGARQRTSGRRHR